MRSIAYQQLRICNLENCIKAVKYQGESYSFNLSLTDPINDFLEEGDKVYTCEGDFTVTIGTESSIKNGLIESLPLIKGNINGFTRLWIGIIPATTIGLVEDLQIDDVLIDNLVNTFYKPEARSDLDY